MNCTLPHLVDGVEEPCTDLAVVMISDGESTAYLCVAAYAQWNSMPGDSSHLTIVELKS